MCTDFLKERKEKKEQIKKESLQWTCCQVKDGIKKHDHDMVGTFNNYIQQLNQHTYLIFHVKHSIDKFKVA